MAEISPDLLAVMTEERHEALFGLGLAQLKTEGEAFAYDPGAGPVPPMPWRDRLMLRWEVLGHRLRWLPTRLWWAVFGDEYY